MKPTRAPQLHHQSGFTLVEVLAALAIFSISILGLMRAGTQSVKAVYILEQKEMASIVADNQIALARLYIRAAAQENQPQIMRLERSGKSVQGGYEFNWQRDVAPTDLKAFSRLSVSVFAATRPSSDPQLVLKRNAFVGSSVVTELNIGVWPRSQETP